MKQFRCRSQKSVVLEKQVVFVARVAPRGGDCGWRLCHKQWNSCELQPRPPPTGGHTAHYECRVDTHCVHSVNSLNLCGHTASLCGHTNSMHNDSDVVMPHVQTLDYRTWRMNYGLVGSIASNRTESSTVSKSDVPLEQVQKVKKGNSRLGQIITMRKIDDDTSSAGVSSDRNLQFKQSWTNY